MLGEKGSGSLTPREEKQRKEKTNRFKRVKTRGLFARPDESVRTEKTVQIIKVRLA